METGACCQSNRCCSWLLLIARLLIGGGTLFLSGLSICLLWSDVRLFAASYGFDMHAPTLVGSAIVYLVLGGLILLGYWLRTTCAVALCLALPFLFFRLSFWGLAGYQATVAQTFFTTTAAMIGGFILFMLTGPGRYALPSSESDWGESASFRSWGLILGRVLIGGCYFLWNGIWTLVEWEFHLMILEAWKIPAPHLVLWLMVAIEIIGGAMILLGWRHRVAAWVLIVYVALVALCLHRFWAIDPSLAAVVSRNGSISLFVNNVYVRDKVLQAKFFLDSLGIMGALFVLTTCISGRYSCKKERAV